MSVKLPQSVVNYLDADRDGDMDKLSRCFTKDARVQDEHYEYEGIEAIRSWRSRSDSRIEPMRAAVTEKNVRLHARQSGGSAQSSTEFDYTFVLADGRIASLDIARVIG